MPVKKSVAFTLKHLGFSYGNRKVLDDITIDIRDGDYLGVVGPNGGGKTTLVKLLIGVLRPTAGEIRFFGEPLSSSRLRSRIGYVPQRASALGEFFPATVEEVVWSGRTPRKGPFASFHRADRLAVEHAMEAAGVAKLSRRRIAELSGGERQRVLIARALAAEPKVLILDEPTSAVDVSRQEQLYKFLRDLREKLHLTIILISHDLDIVSHEVDQVLCLNGHMVCHGPAETLKDHPKMIHGHH